MPKIEAKSPIHEQISGHCILDTTQMAEADRQAIADGPFDGYGLMRNAGLAIAREILARFPQAGRIAILCGPGNNGGDGYVIARLLSEDGLAVRLFALAAPKAGGDAARAARDCRISAEPLEAFDPTEFDLIVDALFGAGLAKPVTGAAAKAIDAAAASGVPVVAVDLPSGLSGDTGAVLGTTCEAALTVTFFRKKPSHLLYPGRQLCGDVVVADIGIGAHVLDAIDPASFENHPALWQNHLPAHDLQVHKYARGGVGVFSGGPASTGAARLAAMAAVRAGAGAVTVLSPAAAMLVNATHLTEIMLARVEDEGDLDTYLATGRAKALVVGPGFGLGARLRNTVLKLLDPAHAPSGEGRGLGGIVLDADALTEFAEAPDELFAAINATPVPVVLTPHEGEFKRLFADLAGDASRSKLQRARQAAARSGATVIYKGADTVIAAPDGRAAINTNGSPVLATAGSGDVLAGLVSGLLAQDMPAWEAACAAVWVHGEAGCRAGFGAMAGEIADASRTVLAGLLESVS